MRNYNTLFVGKVLHHFEQIPSTNEYAIKLIAKSKPSEGTVISSHSQTAGKGQFGRQWESPPGLNLYLSLILYPSFLAANRQFLLSQAMALAVSDAIKACIPSQNIDLKWPNDIYINQHKTAGILIQNTLSGPHIQSSIIGIGLNINQTEFPARLPNPTSLALIAGHSLELADVQASLFQSIESRYLSLRANHIDQIESDYLAQLLDYGVDRYYTRQDGQTFIGRITGLDKNGKLAITHAGGTEYFAMGEVRRV